MIHPFKTSLSVNPRSTTHLPTHSRPPLHTVSPPLLRRLVETTNDYNSPPNSLQALCPCPMDLDRHPLSASKKDSLGWISTLPEPSPSPVESHRCWSKEKARIRHTLTHFRLDFTLDLACFLTIWCAINSGLAADSCHPEGPFSKTLTATAGISRTRSIQCRNLSELIKLLFTGNPFGKASLVGTVISPFS
jgi:hypothetical protein